MMISGCLKAGELRILGTREGVLLNSGDSFIIIIIPASSDHDPVLKFYGTSIAENEDDNNINMDSVVIIYTAITRSDMAN